MKCSTYLNSPFTACNQNSRFNWGTRLTWRRSTELVPCNREGSWIHVIITHRAHNRTNQTSTQVKLTFPYQGCYIQRVQPVRGRWKMLNCNRRTPNERDQLETPSSIFTREAGGGCNVLWDGRRRLFTLKFAEAINVNQSRLLLVNFRHCDKSSRPN